MKESELLHAVIALCEKHNVLVFHSTDSRRDVGRGFPDLVLVGQHGVLFVELKADTGTRRPNQTTWGYRLLAADAHYGVMKPRDLESGYIRNILEKL